MAEGIAWHLGAGLLSVWLAFLYVRRGRRLEEIEGALLALLAVEGEPPRPLVRRALCFLEEECADVLGTTVRLEQPAPAQARDAAAALVRLLANVRASTGAQQALPFAQSGQAGFKMRWDVDHWEVNP